jgi:alkylation response protein AidB-like acyl-CoA dehydrogenase
MDLEYSADERAFRDEVRAFVAKHLPADLAAKVHEGKRLSRDDFLRWHRILHKQGWVAAGWPKEFGGPGWTPVQQHIFDEECAAAGAPIVIPFGVRFVAPVIQRFGNAAQKAHFLPRILSGEDWWCQGYSEPGAGSDLASLKTRAVRQGDHYVVNGQKTWTTLGQHADWIFCLVRTGTEGRPQEGISFLLIDMKTPGVTVRPIRTLEGEHEINEIWFEDVKVPVANLVGEENKGWTYAKFLLGHERTGIAGVGPIEARAREAEGHRAARALGWAPSHGGRTLPRPHRAARDRGPRAGSDQPSRALRGRQAARPGAGSVDPQGARLGDPAIALGADDARHRPLRVAARARGARCRWERRAGGRRIRRPLAGTYFNFRKTSIYSGSNEIQKNIISQMILGL